MFSEKKKSFLLESSKNNEIAFGSMFHKDPLLKSIYFSPPQSDSNKLVFVVLLLPKAIKSVKTPKKVITI